MPFGLRSKTRPVDVSTVAEVETSCHLSAASVNRKVKFLEVPNRTRCRSIFLATTAVLPWSPSPTRTGRETAWLAYSSCLQQPSDDRRQEVAETGRRLFHRREFPLPVVPAPPLGAPVFCGDPVFRQGFEPERGVLERLPQVSPVLTREPVPAGSQLLLTRPHAQPPTARQGVSRQSPRLDPDERRQAQPSRALYSGGSSSGRVDGRAVIVLTGPSQFGEFRAPSSVRLDPN